MFGRTYLMRSDENRAMDDTVEIVSDDGVTGSNMYVIGCYGKRVVIVSRFTREKKEID